ncbi:MAG: acylneuraminate cytidylyltransferase [Verrucomicrobiota bacterium]
MTPTIAIIPARGGSKGIPRKNVALVAGQPLIAWTIEAAREATRVDAVIVSTDDPEIATVARQYGARVVDRPAELATDRASSESALLHVLDHLESAGETLAERFVFLQCTSPLTSAADIDGTIEVMERDGADSALAVAPSHDFIWKPGPGGDWAGVNHDKAVRLRRQDREPEFVETGAVYVMKTAGFRTHGHRFFGRTTAYVQAPECRVEIDEPADLELVGELLRRRQGAAPGLPWPEALVMDFDGVLTDDAVLVNQEGTESVRCHRGDGLGLEMLRERGLPLFILSRETNPVVAARAAKLQIPVVHGSRQKGEVLADWAAEQGHDLARIVYVGNDLNDLECLRLVGWPVAVADAHPEVRQAARYVLTRSGGCGAVRELAELLLAARA